MPFLTPLRVEHLPNGRKRLIDELIYDGRTERFIVPAEFVTDFASTPRILWSLMPPDDPRYVRAAVLHDWLYTIGSVSRADADGIFRRIMREHGVGLVRRYVMWAAVRAFGWRSWGKARLAEIASGGRR